MPPAANELRHRRVLFVDDEAALVTLAAHALERVGYEVVPAHNGLQALDALKRNRGALHAIVLDLVLPDIAGGELLDRLRDIDPSIPVIVASGLDREQALRTAPGISVFLHKPYTLAELCATLDALTGASTA